MDIIHVENLKKSYANVQNVKIVNIIKDKVKKIVILDGVSFEVKPGEILGVMGKNGAGKSTLLRVLGQVYGYESGVININGNVASIFEMGAFMNVFQTGREYCIEYFNFTQEHKINLDDIVSNIEEFIEIGEFFDKPIHTYSSGMMAKLLFAVATAFPSDVILIDEVLVVGDEYFQKKAWKRLCEMLDQGTGGIIVTHDWVSLLKLCERAIIIDNKSIVFDGTTQNAVRKYLDFKDIESKEITLINKDSLCKKTIICDNKLEFEFSLKINLGDDTDKICVICFIERYMRGVGWNLVGSAASAYKIDEIGVAGIILKIPELNLEAGNYFFGIQVCSFKTFEDKSFDNVLLDMSWLNGNSINMLVTGENKNNALVKKRLKWKISYL